MKRFIPFIITLIALSACDHRENLSDAYGNFEAEDVIVSAEATGKLIQFNLSEGMQLDEGQVVGLIDTVGLTLQIDQLDAQQGAVESKLAGIKAQIAAQEQQKVNIQVSYDRVVKLVESGAATQQQKDDLEGQLKLVQKQIEASKAQITSVWKEVDVLEAQKDLLIEKLSKCTISSPEKGVVLEKYVREGEIAVAGKPLFKIADLSTLDLRCYVSGDKLSKIKLGQQVKVLTDSGKDSMDELQGTVSWISGEAEFTPKIIQTKEERVKLVYAVKVKVKNDGRLKVGMPGEMVIGHQPSAISH